MTEEDLQLKFASKIAALLRKAESTTPEEAEALTEKAQELMSRYAIEQGLVDAARDGEKPEKIVERKITYTGWYAKARRGIGEVVARANGCKLLYQSGSRDAKILFVIGFEGDVERAIMLDASLQIQGEAASRAWARDGGIKDWMSRWERIEHRRGFLDGFSSGVKARLSRAAESARRDVVAEHAEAEHVSEETVAESVALVVRTRKERIEDWVDETYGKLSSSRERGSYSPGSSHSQGYAAGLRANTGHGGALKERRQVTA